MRHHYTLLAALLVLLSGACQASATERDFAEDMLARFREASPGGSMEIKADEPLVIQVKQSAGWEEASINLHRVYGYCQNASAEDCDALKVEFVSNITKTSRPEPGTKSGLRIIVREEEYVAYVRSTFKDGKQSVPMREIGEGLYAILAFDTAKTIGLATFEGIAKIGLNEGEAWELAMRQTMAILPQVPRDKLAQRQPVAFQDYEYLASLLADTGMWTKISEQAGPEMFVTAVSDGFVFVAFMPNGTKLEKFKQTVADDCKAQPRCVSPFIYRFRNGRWKIAE